MLAPLPLLAAAGPLPGPDLLLVTIDTLRADRVGACGLPAGATPALDALAREGVLFEDAVAHVPQTRPSHACLFTGRLPFEHGIRDNFSKPLDPGTPTLASILKERGYATGGFIGAHPGSRGTRLQRGCAAFDEPVSAPRAAAAPRPPAERTGHAGRDRALARSRARTTHPDF